MATSITICNVALLRLGIARAITTLTDGTAESIPCNLVYARCVTRTLEDFPWPFASRYVTLGQPVTTDDGTQAWTNQYRYTYAYPSNCARVIRIATPLGKRDAQPPFFEVGTSPAGVLEVRCNLAPSSTTTSDLFVEYTHNTTDVTLFTETYASAVSWLVAFEIAAALRVDAATAIYAYNMYLAATHQAERALGAQSRADPDPDGPLLRSRTGLQAGGQFGGDSDNPYYASGFVV